MNTQYTAGPWHVHGCSVYQQDCWNAGNNEGGRYICSTFYGSPEDENDDCPGDIHYNNARLIAAAPELLEACKAALAEMEAFRAYWTSPGMNLCRSKVLAEELCQLAISKAINP